MSLNINNLPGSSYPIPTRPDRPSILIPGEDVGPTTPGGGKTAEQAYADVAKHMADVYIDFENQGVIAVDDPRFDFMPDFAVDGSDEQQDASKVEIYKAATELAPVDLQELFTLLITVQAEMKKMNREERAADATIQNQASLDAIGKVEDSTKSNFIGTMVSGSMSIGSGFASVGSGVAGVSALKDASRAATTASTTASAAIAPAGTTDPAALAQAASAGSSAASAAFGNAMQPFTVTQQYSSGLSSALQGSGQITQGSMTQKAGEADADKLDKDRQADRAKDKRDISNEMMQTGADTIAKALATIGQANDAAHQSNMQAVNNIV